MAETLTPEEVRELSQLFSGLVGHIHSLTALQTQVLMEVDEHMRGDQLSRIDLERLKSVSTNHTAH